MSAIVHSVHSLKHIIQQNVQNQPVTAFGHGFKNGLGGNMLNIPFVAFEVGSAQRGEMASTALARSGGMLTYPALVGVIAAGIAMIPGVNVAAGLIASVVAMYPNSLLEETAIRKINWLNQTGHNIRHLETGGNYTDTDYAQRARQRSLMELSSAGGASRRYLGNEALFAHR